MAKVKEPYAPAQQGAAQQGAVQQAAEGEDTEEEAAAASLR